jgi:hypothetical protein
VLDRRSLTKRVLLLGSGMVTAPFVEYLSESSGHMHITIGQYRP